MSFLSWIFGPAKPRAVAALPTPGQVAPASAGIPVEAPPAPPAPAPAPPAIPPEAIVLLHHYESCARRLPSGLLAPYLDGGGVATIGWGNTYWEDGRKVTMADAPITQARADALFAFILAGFHDRLLTVLPDPGDPEAVSACLSFVYNVGWGDPSRKVDGFLTSTALKRLRAGDLPGAAEALQWWNKDGGKVVKGLQRRRRAEALVLLGATADSAIARAEKDFP